MSSFSMQALIEQKKFGRALSREEIESWVSGVVSGEVPHYQTAALLMAIRLKGMDFEETLALTTAMTESGDRLRFNGHPILADKHSTGGVGDKVTLILAPLLAAVGVPVTMLSGRGLGFTGGTIDKFESLPSVSCNQDNAAMQKMLDTFGWANAQASERIAPADRLLYGLRDVTGTVDSIPLITASILSKKMAGGATHLCLDVKCGASAFMPDLAQAKELAENLKTIGEMGGLAIQGLISHMEEPLGHAIGNYLELLESVHYLKEEQKTPLMELVFALGAKMMVQTGFAKSPTEAMAALRQVLASGAGLDKLTDYLTFCGGDQKKIEELKALNFEDLPRIAVPATKSGVVARIHGRGMGELAVQLGAGRKKHDDVIDPIAGILLNKQVGDQVEKGEPLAWLFGEKAQHALAATRIVALMDLSAETPRRTNMVRHEF